MRASVPRANFPQIAQVLAAPTGCSFVPMVKSCLIRDGGSEMFAGRWADDEVPHAAEEMLRVLDAAGCDITDERSLQMGMVAHHAALLVSAHRTRNTSVAPARKSRTGRNEPCPCGSGRKYKKCCLDADRGLSADNDSALVELAPEILPRLWDDHAMVKDCVLLGQIIDRDPAFVNAGFSPEKVAAFMDRLFGQEASPFGDANLDEDERGRAVDDLAVRYMRESGDRRATRGVQEKLLDAVRRAKSKDELRALATGVCLALRAEVTKDPEDNLLGIILFRRTLFAVARPTQIVKKLLDRLSMDEDELRRLVDANDPSINEKIESAVNELSASELKALEAVFEKRDENLWDTIVADKFPVPMPVATQMALLGRLTSASSKKTPSQEDFRAIVNAFCEELIEDDYALYGQMLDRWLGDSSGQPGRIVDAVKLMRELCAIKSIKDWLPRLLVHDIRTKRRVPFDEEEQHFVEAGDFGTLSEFIAEYSSWLKTKGYAGMADRLLLSWKDCDASSREMLLRNASAA